MKYVVLILAYTVPVGCGAVVLTVVNHHRVNNSKSSVDHNKEDYRQGDVVVHKKTGRICYIRNIRKHRDLYNYDETRSRVYLSSHAYLSEIGANPCPERLSDIEKLKLPKPAAEIGDRVKSKKSGLTGTVESRHQGFNEWIYRVRLDKDFENYEETGYSSFHDPRKYQEWDESDIRVFPYEQQTSSDFPHIGHVLVYTLYFLRGGR